MKKSSLLFVQVIFLSILVLVIPQRGFAEQKNGVEFNGYNVSPSIINLKAKQGETIRHFFKVSNETENQVQLMAVFKDFEKKGDQLIFKNNVPYEWSVAKWTSLKGNEYPVEPNTTFDIPFEINIPKTAELGEHVGLLSLKFDGGEVKKSGQNVTTELLPAIFIIVTDENGNANTLKKWKLLDYEADRINGGNISFKVKNTGNIHLQSKGTITLKNLFTGEKETIQIPSVNLLRDVKKEITVTWKPDQIFAIYDVSMKISLDGDRFETIDTTFFAIHWVIASLFIIVCLILVGLPIWVFRLKKQLQRIENNTKISDK